MMSTFSKLVCSSVIAVGLITGCSSGDPLADDDANGGDEDVVEQRYGALSAEVSTNASGDVDGVDVQAQFLDARGVAVDSALDALEVWAPRRELQEGDCQFHNPDFSAPDGHEPASLHLLDVGDIAIEAPRSEEFSLQPRHLPDLLNSFYGVVYGSQWSRHTDTGIVDYHPGGQYRFVAPGSVDAGGFDITLEAPSPVVLAAANGHEVYDREAIAVARGQQLELVWETDGDEQGEVFVELAIGSGPDDARLQCKSADSGAFTVPGSRLSELADMSDGATLELRRVHRRRAAVDGLDEADFYFSTTDRIDVRFAR